MAKQAIFDKKNVLVIGGAGFMGSHLCDELVKTNKVICIDNFSTGTQKNIDHLLADPNFVFIRHDMAEPISLDDNPSLQQFKIKFQGIQEIYNAACPSSPKNFSKNLRATLLANSLVVKNSLDLAQQYKSKFLHFSSSVVYGPRTDSSKKVAEGDLGLVDFLSERAAYDEGKRFAETMVANYFPSGPARTTDIAQSGGPARTTDIAQSGGEVDVKIARVFRTYGPRMPLNDNQMIPDFVRDAIDNKDLTIYGDKDFSSSFCYISDVVDAVIKLIGSEVAGPVNIGSDVLINFTDLAQKIIEQLESSSSIKYQDPDMFMTPLCVPDISKASNELGWLPIVTLDNGLKLTIDDLRASKGLKGMDSIDI